MKQKSPSSHPILTISWALSVPFRQAGPCWSKQVPGRFFDVAPSSVKNWGWPNHSFLCLHKSHRNHQWSSLEGTFSGWIFLPGSLTQKVAPEIWVSICIPGDSEADGHWAALGESLPEGDPGSVYLASKMEKAGEPSVWGWWRRLSVDRPLWSTNTS